MAYLEVAASIQVMDSGELEIAIPQAQAQPRGILRMNEC